MTQQDIFKAAKDHKLRIEHIHIHPMFRHVNVLILVKWWQFLKRYRIKKFEKYVSTLLMGAKFTVRSEWIPLFDQPSLTYSSLINVLLLDAGVTYFEAIEKDTNFRNYMQKQVDSFNKSLFKMNEPMRKVSMSMHNLGRSMDTIRKK